VARAKLAENKYYLDDFWVDMGRRNTALNPAFTTFDHVDVMARLEANQVPFSKINTLGEVIHDPLVVAMESLAEFEYVIAGPMR
jgi:crotonobetainyl-CoA:carnitine CoA-transferase CaiB-like acyl-CoA transferase